MRALLEKCAMTTLSSKLVASKKEFFAKMVVDAVLQLDDLLPLNMIGKRTDTCNDRTLEVVCVCF